MIYYVYVYLDPRKNGGYKYPGVELSHKPFYVGKGRKERWRPSGHNKTNQYLINKINKIGCDNVIVRFIRCDSNRASMNTEKELIRLIGRKDLGFGPLLNMTDGGEDGHRVFTEQHRKNLSKSLKNMKLSGEQIKERNDRLEKTQFKKGHKQSEEVSRKRIESFKRHYETYDGYWKNKVGSFKGYRHTEEAKATISRKKKQYFIDHPEKIKEISKKTKEQWTKAESGPRAKLNWDIVNEIRGSYKKGDVISDYAKKYIEKYKITKYCIYDILQGRTWNRERA